MQREMKDENLTVKMHESNGTNGETDLMRT